MPSKPDERIALTVTEVMALLGVGRNTVYEGAARGEIPHRRLGKRLLFSRDAIAAWLGERPTIVVAPPPPPAAEPMTLEEAYEDGRRAVEAIQRGLPIPRQARRRRT